MHHGDVFTHCTKLIWTCRDKYTRKNDEQSGASLQSTSVIKRTHVCVLAQAHQPERMQFLSHDNDCEA